MRSTQPRTIDYKNTSHEIYNLFQNKILIKILRSYFIPSLPRISFTIYLCQTDLAPLTLTCDCKVLCYNYRLFQTTFFFQSQLIKRDSTLTSTANEFSFITISIKNVEKRFSPYMSLALIRIPPRNNLWLH